MRLIAALALVALAGCCAAAAPDEEDPFPLAIDAGRLGVFNDRIAAALGLSPPSGAPVSEIQGAAAGLRETAFAFYGLKARACRDGKFKDVSCAPSHIPAWLGEAGGAEIAPAALRRRIDALYEEMGPLLDAACAYGRRAQKDALFCSVE